MVKFLHIADIHLGIRRYRSEDRARDFFYAWRDCIERYALAEASFVLIAGDFFDARKVEPQAMNQAMYCLSRLREAKIPVIAIEGNHDCHRVRKQIQLAAKPFAVGIHQAARTGIQRRRRQPRPLG